MVRSAARYRRALKRKLHCAGNTRNQTLARFDSSLSAFLEDHPAATYAELTAAFGPAEEMAQVMMEGVSQQEQDRYYRKKSIARITAWVLAVACMLFAIYAFFIKSIPVEIYDSVYEETGCVQEGAE